MVAHQEVFVDDKCRISLFTSNIIWASSELVNSSSSTSFKLELLIVFPLPILSTDAFFLIFALSSVVGVDDFASVLKIRTFCVHFLSFSANEVCLLCATVDFSHDLTQPILELAHLRLLSRLKVVVVVWRLHEKLIGSYGVSNFTTDW